jgi:hypothetical protein
VTRAVSFVDFSTWSSNFNNLNVNFLLFSTYDDLLANRNAWRFCNYDDAGVAFPRDCGPSGDVPSQWNTVTPARAWSAAVARLRAPVRACAASAYARQPTCPLPCPFHGMLQLTGRGGGQGLDVEFFVLQKPRACPLRRAHAPLFGAAIHVAKACPCHQICAYSVASAPVRTNHGCKLFRPKPCYPSCLLHVAYCIAHVPSSLLHVVTVSVASCR